MLLQHEELFVLVPISEIHLVDFLKLPKSSWFLRDELVRIIRVSIFSQNANEVVHIKTRRNTEVKVFLTISLDKWLLRSKLIYSTLLSAIKFYEMKFANCFFNQNE